MVSAGANVTFAPADATLAPVKMVFAGGETAFEMTFLTEAGAGRAAARRQLYLL
jgi:hypothetical protein